MILVGSTSPYTLGPGTSTDRSVVTWNGTGGLRLRDNPTVLITSAGNLAISAQAYSVIASTLTPSGTTQTIDWNNGNTQALDLSSASGNVTVTLSNGQNGAVYTLFVLQGSGSRNATFTAKWPGGTAPTITVTAGAVDVISFVIKGGLYYGTFSQAFA